MRSPAGSHVRHRVFLLVVHPGYTFTTAAQAPVGPPPAAGHGPQPPAPLPQGRPPVIPLPAPRGAAVQPSAGAPIAPHEPGSGTQPVPAPVVSAGDQARPMAPVPLPPLKGVITVTADGIPRFTPYDGGLRHALLPLRAPGPHFHYRVRGSPSAVEMARSMTVGDLYPPLDLRILSISRLRPAPVLAVAPLATVEQEAGVSLPCPPPPVQTVRASRPPRPPGLDSNTGMAPRRRPAGPPPPSGPSGHSCAVRG